MNHVFMTGATGALGSALVPLFLEEPDTEVTALVRAGSADHLEKRRDALRRWWAWPVDDPRLSRLQCVAGDVVRPGFDMDDSVHRSLQRRVTHIVHAAGDVKLSHSLSDARRQAVDAVREVTRFADACCERAAFQKLDVISTVGVAGCRAGRLLEEPVTEPRAFRNSYEQAKAEAETWLLERMHGGLPATIHRPSMVVGDSRTGAVAHFQVFYHLSEFLAGLKTWGIVPQSAMRLDLIPVDYVARAVHLSTRTPAAIGRIFHLCSGPEHSLPLTALSKMLWAAYARRGRRMFRLRPIPVSAMRAFISLAAPWLTGDRRRLFRSLPWFLAYMDDEQLFENEHSRSFFENNGMTGIPSVSQYLDRILQYYWNSPSHAPPLSVAA